MSIYYFVNLLNYELMDALNVILEVFRIVAGAIVTDELDGF
ncbi:MAG: hypothetical protein WAT46_08495 [Saprospiraceae bacterium]